VRDQAGDAAWITVRITPGARRDDVLAALFDAGAEGVQELPDSLVTHAHGSDDATRLELAALAVGSGVTVQTEPLQISDWSERWKQALAAQRVGRLTIAPPWLAEGWDPKTTIVIDPGMAFGTGDHATTRSVVMLLQDVVRPGDRVADLGAGSAVLAIAAAKLGASRVVAIELDPDAIENAAARRARTHRDRQHHLVGADRSVADDGKRARGRRLRDSERDSRVRAVDDGRTPRRRGLARRRRNRRGRMVERDRRTAIATFYCEGPLVAGIPVTPSDDVRHHLRARRLDDGDAVQLTNGDGLRAAATIRARGKREIELAISSVTSVARQPAIHLRAPVADRDRMLWLAEKATELEVASWQGVRFRRSASVTPRGEGEGFSAKMRARMVSALEQSGGGWLPPILPDADMDSAARESGLRVVMDRSGKPLASLLGRNSADGVTLMVGPEGGIEDDELELLETGGWLRARLGAATLRFETAAVAAIGVIRAAQESPEG
jgi:RsmE family RNA methyltransferase